jgi:NAD(P)-dependent dehydrogenase (short-subunit alcohol dehydrogenase family)
MIIKSTHDSSKISLRVKRRPIDDPLTYDHFLGAFPEDNVEFDFVNKNVLVTGSSRGIGRAIAQRFAESGARVAIHYHKNRQAAERTFADLPGGPHLLVQADVSDPLSVQEMVDTVLNAMERIHVLVNNAGIFEEYPIIELTYEQWQEKWERTIQTNLLGPANTSFCLIQHMKKQGGGKIVNVSSRGAFRGEPDAPAYGASKAGLNSLSQSMALALAQYNVFVYVVAPGFIDTDMTAEMLSGPKGDAIRGQSPLGRVALPEEIARTVVFLASEGTDYLTGCIVDVNGASYLRSYK